MTHILHKQIYAGLFEVIKDNKMFYNSAVSRDYSHLTDEGKEAVIKWIETMGPAMLELEKQQLDARAKKLVWEELKK